MINKYYYPIYVFNNIYKIRTKHELKSLHKQTSSYIPESVHNKITTNPPSQKSRLQNKIEHRLKNVKALIGIKRLCIWWNIVILSTYSKK